MLLFSEAAPHVCNVFTIFFPKTSSGSKSFDFAVFERLIFTINDNFFKGIFSF